MSIQTLTNGVQFRRVMNAESAATTTHESDAVDVRGFDSCLFLLQLGTVTNGSTVTLSIEGRETQGSGSWKDIGDTAAALANANDDSNLMLQTELRRPSPWSELRAKVVIADENAVVDSCIACLTAPQHRPVDIHDDVEDSAFALGGVEG